VEHWQSRVIKEHEQLSAKINKLSVYLTVVEYSDADVLLVMQLHAMMLYLEVLQERIKTFTVKEDDT
jgi:hypothetical protein